MDDKKRVIYYYLYEIRVENKDSVFDGKYYYGMHQTYDLCDGYMGSSALLKKYKKKWGLKGLNKRILNFYDTLDELIDAERILVEQKMWELKDKCLNLSDGGKGGFSYINKYLFEHPEIKHENAVAGGKGNKNRLLNPEQRKEASDTMKHIHANRSIEERHIIYDKIATSLKTWYAEPDNRDNIEAKQRKNKESNKKTSKKWRIEFKNLFGHSPEYYRSYGKMQESLDIFHSNESEKIRALNEYCATHPKLSITESTRDKYSIHAKAMHKADRDAKSAFIYKVDEEIFTNGYDFLTYINNRYSEIFQAKISPRILSLLEKNQPCSQNCKKQVKELFKYIQEKVIIIKKGDSKYEY